VDDEPDAPPVDEDDPLGDEALEPDEPLGDDELDEPDDDAPVEEPPEVELLPLGDADGLLLEDELIWTPSLDAVSLSRRPVAFRPSFCW